MLNRFSPRRKFRAEQYWTSPDFRPDLKRLEGYHGPLEIRRYRLERFPYLVIVLFRPDDLLVVAVSHLRRCPLYWLDRLGYRTS